MATILLTVTESESELISGIPEYVEFDTNIASTIFYTFDGSDPDSSSDIAVGMVYLPTDVSVHLKAVAVSGPDSSEIYEDFFRGNSIALTRTRNVGDEGINVYPYEGDVVDSLGYDADGSLVKNTVIDKVDLDLRPSRVNRIGEKLPFDSSDPEVNFQDRDIGNTSIENRVSSPNENNINFDPRAGHIIIDGSTEEKFNNQVLRIINRPYNSMNVISDSYNEHLPSRSLVSSSLSRMQYNPKTGTVVFYYRDSRENRWIKSVQKTETKTMNLTPRGGNRFVFQWIEDRHLSKIF